MNEDTALFIQEDGATVGATTTTIRTTSTIKFATGHQSFIQIELMSYTFICSFISYVNGCDKHKYRLSPVWRVRRSLLWSLWISLRGSWSRSGTLKTTAAIHHGEHPSHTLPSRALPPGPLASRALPSPRPLGHNRKYLCNSQPCHKEFLSLFIRAWLTL